MWIKMLSNREVLSLPPLVPHLQSSTSGMKNTRDVWCLYLCTFCDRAYSLHSKVTNAICKGDTCQVNNTALADLNSREDLNCTFFEGKGIHNKKCCKDTFLLHPVSINEQDSRFDMLIFDIQVLSYASVLTEMLKDKLSLDSLIFKGLISNIWFVSEIPHILSAIASSILQLACPPPSLMTSVKGISSRLTLKVNEIAWKNSIYNHFAWILAGRCVGVHEKVCMLEGGGIYGKRLC